MRSSFSTPRRSIVATARPYIDETYDLRGVNLTTPDQIMPTGETPYAINNRMYARNDGETRVASRTRKGIAYLSSPIGSTLDAQNVGTSTGDLDFTTTRILAQPFTPSTSNCLTKIELELKKAAGANGHVIVEVATDSSGVPGTVIAESSILASDISSSYAYLPARFVDAPFLSSSSQYWVLVYVQDNGAGTYYVNQTADTGALDLESTDAAASRHTLDASFHFKSYLSTSGGVKGYVRRYPSDGNNRTVFAHKTNIYSATDAGVATSISSAVDASSSKVRFENIDDKTMWVDGYGAPRQWDGTTVSSIPNAPLGATHIIAHQNRIFMVIDKVLVRFTELYDFATWPSVNFFYVPNPKSSDPITGWRVFQDSLVIFTHETKHIVYGSDISTFTRKQAIGTKGAVSDEAIAVDKNYIYFMADDGMIYRWNGANDELVSDKMEPEFANIVDKSQVRLVLYRNQLRVYYPRTPSATNNAMALLDLTYSTGKNFQWFMDTGKPLVGAMELTQDDNELIEFSSMVGQFYTGETGYSDMGKAIDFKYWTPYKSYGSGSSAKRVKSFRPILRTVNADYTLAVGKDIDFKNIPDMREYIVSGGGAKWGSGLKWGDGSKWGKNRMIDNRAGMSGRGKHIQYRIERKGVETPVELYGYIAQVKIGRPK